MNAALTPIRPLPIRSLNFARMLTTLLLAALMQPAVAAETVKDRRGSFSGARETVYPDWFKNGFLELADDVREAAQNDKRVMVFFHQAGCPYCNRLVEENLARKSILAKVRTQFDVIAIDIWGDRDVLSVAGKPYTEKAFAAALKVQYTPTLLFFDERGKIVLRLNGYQPPRNFSVALDYVAGHHESTASYRDYLAANLPPSASGTLNPEPFFSTPPYILTRDPASTTRPLAVFFESRQCPGCDTLHRRVLRDPMTRDLIKRFESVQLDMWTDTPLVTPDRRRTTARAWAAELNIVYAPTIVYFDRGGREVMRSDSFLKIFHTQSVMDYVLSGAYRSEPNFQRYISARADRLRAAGIDVDIWR